MKVLHCLNHFLPAQTAGTEVYTYSLCKQLQDKGIEVKVVIPNYGKTESSEYVHDGIDVFQFPEPSSVDRSLIMGFTVAQGVTYFKQYLDKEKPDIVHFHELAGSNGFGLNHLLAAKQSGLKVIMTFHLASYTCKSGTLVYMGKRLYDGKINIKKCSRCYLHQKGNNRLLNNLLLPVSLLLYKLNVDSTLWKNKAGTALGTPFLIKKLRDDFNLLVSTCDRVVVLTDWYRKILLLNKVKEDKISLIRQGLPFEETDNFITTTAKRNNELRLIFVGRISSFKGVHLILDALEQMDSEKIFLDIYGYDPMDQYSINQIKRMSMIRGVKWKVGIIAGNVVTKMKEYDALILASTFSEMSPLVIQEAYAAGIPVIASNVYGNAEQIEDVVNGWLFKFNDAEDLQQKLQMLIENPNMIREAKKYIPKVRSFSDVAKEYKFLYEEVSHS
jgi:glycosyltransferase involved in cell wall biosynthesis